MICATLAGKLEDPEKVHAFLSLSFKDDTLRCTFYIDKKFDSNCYKLLFVLIFYLEKSEN